MPRKFQYRRQVQCRVCKTFGHDTDEDVCRIGAQVHHAMKFTAQEPEQAEKNASAFSLANNKHTINMVRTDAQLDEEEVVKMEQMAMNLIDPKQE